MKKRKHIKNNCGNPLPVVLGLPAHTVVDMRIRKRLKAETEKKESISTDPTSEDNTAVDQGMLTNETLLVGSSSAHPADDIEPTLASIVASSSKRKNSKKAVQSEISDSVNEAIIECKALNSSQTESADIPPNHEAGDGPDSAGTIKYGRRKKKVRSSSKVDPDFVQEESCSTGLGDSGETLSARCPEDGDEKVFVQGQGSPIQVDDSALLHKNEGGVVNNATKMLTEGYLSKQKGSVTNSEEIIQKHEKADLNDVSTEAGDSSIFPEEKSLDDECVKVTPEEPLDTLVSDSSRHARNDASKGDVDLSSPGRSLIPSSGKKLLVLDLNGLIADIVRYIPERHTPDKVIAMKAVFKRPFYEDFLQFCFARFNVGVWSSRAKSNVHSVVDFLLGEAKQNLLFCWDQSHCTQTGYFTVENRQKPLLTKKLKKLWEKHDPDLPWKLGEYNETNTLMLDDSPYKALFNPPHTAIFPPTYSYTDKDDNSLGPGGALRIYLEGLAGAEDVQEFVKQHPFGQRAITEKNASWRFYQKVLETGLITPGKAYIQSSVEVTDGNVDLDSSKKTLESCTEPPEQKASVSGRSEEESKQEMETGKPDAKLQEIKSCNGDFDSGNKALNVPVEQRASGSVSRHLVHDSDGPRQKRREAESELVIQSGEPVIQSVKVDFAPANKTLDLRDESLEQKVRSSPRLNMLRDSVRPHERRGFERKGDGDEKVQNRELVGFQGMRSGKGDLGSAHKPLHSRSESRERRASRSPRRQYYRLHQRRFERRGESGQQGLQHGEPVGGQVMHRGKRAFDCANKTVEEGRHMDSARDSRPESRERRSMFYDANRPQWKRWGVDTREEPEPGLQSGMEYPNSNMDSRGKSLERRASGSPRRHTDRPHWKREVERRVGERNSDYNLQRASNFMRFDDNAMAGGDSHEYSSFDIRSSDWSMGRGVDWSRESGSSRGRGSDWNNRGRSSGRGRSSDWSRERDFGRGRVSDWNNRGRGSDWNNRASQESEKWPVPYDHKGSHQSSGFTSYYSQRAAEKSRGFLGPVGRGEWKPRPYQRPVSLDRRVGGYSFNNRYSAPSFHWQAYR